MVQSGVALAMVAEKPVRRSVSLPARTARRVRALVKSKGVSENHVLVNLIESGLAAKEQERERFLALADRLTATRDPAEQMRIKEELARLTFGS